MSGYRLGLIGFGKIAQQAHLPAIAADPAFELVAVADPSRPPPDNVAGFSDYRAMLKANLALDVVAICTPPAARGNIAAVALAAGMHVLLEKPPAASAVALAALQSFAVRHGRVLFTAWHSRYNPAVEQARAWLADQVVTGVAVTWMEDVRTWHPGQAWIWQHDGFGVFDPGINALSVMTYILPGSLRVCSAELLFEPRAESPIAADLVFHNATGSGPWQATFDWRPIAEDIREIAVATEDGHTLTLSEGCGMLALDGDVVVREAAAEYCGVYAHFAALLREGVCCVDGMPLQLVSDALALGQRSIV